MSLWLNLFSLMKLTLAFMLSTALAVAATFTRDLPSPAGADSQCSNLSAAPDGTLHLTWSAPSPTVAGERALFLATLPPDAVAWSAPRVIVSTSLLMENWADFASLAVGTDGALTAQWFQKPAGSADAHGYDGWFARSTDRGATWGKPAPLGHEFVALAPLSGGRTLAVWLQSTRVADPHAAPRAKRDPSAPRPARDPAAPYAPSMKLLARLLAPDGSALGEWTVDPDVCTCCQNTVATLSGDRVFVGYRGHTADEIRDNKYAIFNLDQRTWSAPKAIHDDGWKIAACPVNGPAADARGGAYAVAWFTAAEGQPRVFARYAVDTDKSFGPVVRLDLGKPMGRIETVLLADQSALFLWMEIGTADNAAGIYARRLFGDGALSSAQLVTDSTQARTSGFPRAALRPTGAVVMSFTQAGTPHQVRTLEFDPAALGRAPASRSVSLNSRPSALSSISPEFCIAPIVAFHQLYRHEPIQENPRPPAARHRRPGCRLGRRHQACGKIRSGCAPRPPRRHHRRARARIRPLGETRGNPRRDARHDDGV